MGGKFFTKNDVNPCSRILTVEITPLIDEVMRVFAGFFEPLLKLHDRIRVEMLLHERAADIRPARLIDGAVVSHEEPARR